MSEPPVEKSPDAPPPRLSWGARLGLLFGILSGPAYLVWVTGVEGTRVLVVTGIILLIAGCASLAHWLMGLTRR
ncbi:MAG TPA: hypothetical protein VF756_09100 [Thermoanaerobaculia bacterium]